MSEPDVKVRDRGLTVYLFNVGQGDHMLLRLPNGEYGIIDFFHDSNMSAPPALGYLQKLRRRLKPTTPIVLSFVCISHPDFDHVRGLQTFLSWIDDKENNITLKNLWMWPGNIMEDLIKQYEDFGDAVEMSHSTSASTYVSRQLRALFKFREARKRGKRKVKTQFLQGVEKLDENVGGLKAVSLAPLGEHVRQFDRQSTRDFVRRLSYLMNPNPSEEERAKKRRADQNLLSSILLLIYGEHHRLLFGGDAGKTVWAQCIQHYLETGQSKDHGPFQGSFIKASHHGSKHSSAVELWPTILAEGGHVGISAGNKSIYKHPHPETLEHIMAAGRQPDKPTSPPKIWATNTCDACLSSDSYNLPKPIINWVFGQKPSIDPIVEGTLKHYRKLIGSAPANVIGCPAQNLAAFIFRFDPMGQTIRVRKGVSSHAKLAEICAFQREGSLPFPLCAARASSPTS